MPEAKRGFVLLPRLQEVAKVFIRYVEGSHINRPNYADLSLLIEKALNWVNNGSEELIVKVTSEFESLSFEALQQLSEPIYKSPDPEDVGKRRFGP